MPVPDDYATAKTEVTVRGTCGIDFSGISNKLGVLRPVNHYGYIRAMISQELELELHTTESHMV